MITPKSRFRRGWRVSLLILLLTFALAQFTLVSSNIEMQAAACTSISGQNRFGVNEVLGWPGLYPPQRLEQSLTSMAQADISIVRVTFAWKDMQPTQGGVFDYSHLDDMVRIAAEHHIQVLPILLAVPEWSSSAPASVKAQYGTSSPVDHYRPINMRDWLTYVKNVVERYDGDGVGDAPGSPRIAYWEVWNEPNIEFFWPPKPDPAEYVALLKTTYQTIKAADPTAKVVLGGLANAGVNNDGSNYLTSLYQLGAGQYFDVASIHIYSYPPNGIKPVVDLVQSIRDLMNANGDSAKPLWLTEIGWSDAANAWGAPTVSQDAIASFVTQVYSTAMPADRIFWYNFRNIFPNSPDVEHNFGLVNADFTPKPAYKAYQALAQSCTASASP